MFDFACKARGLGSSLDVGASTFNQTDCVFLQGFSFTECWKYMIQECKELIKKLVIKVFNEIIEEN